FEYGVGSPPSLESTYFLKILAFKIDPASGKGINSRTGQQWRAVNNFPNSVPCVYYILKIGPKFFSHSVKGSGMNLGLQVCRFKSVLFRMNCFSFTLFRMTLSEKTKP